MFRNTALQKIPLGLILIACFIFPFRALGKTFPPQLLEKATPQNAQSLWVQGKVLCETGEFKKSIRFLMDLLKYTDSPSERGHALFWLGKSWEATGDYERAQKAYKAALRENPGLPELTRVLMVHQGEAIPLWDPARLERGKNPEPLEASHPPYNKKQQKARAESFSGLTEAPRHSSEKAIPFQEAPLYCPPAISTAPSPPRACPRALGAQIHPFPREEGFHGFQPGAPFTPGYFTPPAGEMHAPGNPVYIPPPPQGNSNKNENPEYLPGGCLFPQVGEQDK